jgi:hypothetical protein
MKNLLLVVCLGIFFGTSVLARKSVDLRLTNNSYDPSSQTLFVDVEVRYTGPGEVTLADQNYRIFYDSKNLELQIADSSSDLPTSLYSHINFLEAIEGVNASNVGDLKFEADLGFINFSIDLLDDLNGGIRIDQASDWTRVAVLKYKVKNDIDPSDIIWSQPGRTDSYATAFVQITEWEGPNFVNPLDVNRYVDFRFNEDLTENLPSISIGPNPASHFLKLEFSQEVENDLQVTIIDNLGRIITTHQIAKGMKEIDMDIAHLDPSSYILEIYNPEVKQRTFAESFILMRH